MHGQLGTRGKAGATSNSQVLVSPVLPVPRKTAWEAARDFLELPPNCACAGALGHSTHLQEHWSCRVAGHPASLGTSWVCTGIKHKFHQKRQGTQRVRGSRMSRTPRTSTGGCSVSEGGHRCGSRSHAWALRKLPILSPQEASGSGIPSRTPMLRELKLQVE